MTGLRIAKAGNFINYDCGCCVEFQLEGPNSGNNSFYLRPCFKHAPNRAEVQEQAELDWERITSSVKSGQ